MKNRIDELYSPFEQSMALSWATAAFSSWLAAHPRADFTERENAYFECVEGGLSVALDFRQKNG